MRLLGFLSWGAEVASTKNVRFAKQLLSPRGAADFTFVAFALNFTCGKNRPAVGTTSRTPMRKKISRSHMKPPPRDVLIVYGIIVTATAAIIALYALLIFGVMP